MFTRKGTTPLQVFIIFSLTKSWNAPPNLTTRDEYREKTLGRILWSRSLSSLLQLALLTRRLVTRIDYRTLRARAGLKAKTPNLRHRKTGKKLPRRNQWFPSQSELDDNKCHVRCTSSRPEMCFYFCLSLFKHILQAKVALRAAKRNKTHREGSPLVFKNVVYVIIFYFFVFLF